MFDQYKSERAANRARQTRNRWNESNKERIIVCDVNNRDSQFELWFNRVNGIPFQISQDLNRSSDFLYDIYVLYIYVI